MIDDLSKLALELAKDNPAIQQAIIDCIANNKGYSIPTGNIITSVFSIEDKDRQDKAVMAVKNTMELRIKDLAHIFGLVSAGLAVKEASGEDLLPEEKTLKDIDIVALATFAVVKYLAFKKEEERNNHDN